MTRRELLGCFLVLILIAGGRLVRHTLMLGADGQWREPGWLEARLPPPPEPVPERRSTRRRLPSAPLDPNSCPEDSLLLLPGVGPALAGRIIEARRAGLHFARARDLQQIRGIGPRSIVKFEPYLTFIKEDSSSLTGIAAREAPAITEP